MTCAPLLEETLGACAAAAALFVAGCGGNGGGGGEARRLDLTVTHPLLLFLRPIAPPLDPLSLAFFRAAHPQNNFYGC